jgi:aryl-alcohol dehydrogenase-like predicted oxidoreductase
LRKRRLGRLGHESSVIVYGAAMLSGADQDTADVSIQQALDGGINHFDTAASYGDAELRLGPWMPRIRDQIFLATKTGERQAEPAWAEINRSLERLQTDHVDLIQAHAVGDIEDLDRVTGKGGSLEALVRARDEGLAGAVGITGHGHAAPATHLEALRRFPFDSVLTPWNYALSRREAYAADYAALVAEIGRQDVALRIIKTLARQNWPSDDHAYTTWYEPLDDQDAVTAAVAWVLSFPEVNAIASAGDVRLLGMQLAAEQAADQLSRAEAERVLDRAAEYSSPFIAMPF